MVEFWKPDSTDALRKTTLIYAPGKTVEQSAAGVVMPAAPEP
jgi:hypothetical protein